MTQSNNKWYYSFYDACHFDDDVYTCGYHYWHYDGTDDDDPHKNSKIKCFTLPFFFNNSWNIAYQLYNDNMIRY